MEPPRSCDGDARAMTGHVQHDAKRSQYTPFNGYFQTLNCHAIIDDRRALPRHNETIMYDNRYIWRGIVPNTLTRARTLLLPPYIKRT